MSCFLMFSVSPQHRDFIRVMTSYLVEVQHGGEGSALQQRGSDQRDQLLEDVPSAQLAQRGRVSHRQRGQETQRHLRHVHVALRDEGGQLGEDRVHHDGGHRRTERHTFAQR